MADGSAASGYSRIGGVVWTMLARRGFKGTLDITQSLTDTGLTSLDMVNLMLAVEAEFDLEIPQAEMTPENFRSIETIERLVKALTPAE